MSRIVDSLPASHKQAALTPVWMEYFILLELEGKAHLGFDFPP